MGFITDFFGDGGKFDQASRFMAWLYQSIDHLYDERFEVNRCDFREAIKQLCNQSIMADRRENAPAVKLIKEHCLAMLNDGCTTSVYQAEAVKGILSAIGYRPVFRDDERMFSLERMPVKDTNVKTVFSVNPEEETDNHEIPQDMLDRVRDDEGEKNGRDLQGV